MKTMEEIVLGRNFASWKHTQKTEGRTDQELLEIAARHFLQWKFNLTKLKNEVKK